MPIPTEAPMPYTKLIHRCIAIRGSIPNKRRSTPAIKNISIWTVSEKNIVIPIQNTDVPKISVIAHTILIIKNLPRYSLYLENLSLKKPLKLPASSSSYTI